MPKYSVVIPTKSRVDTLVPVLRNVLASARRDIEVIVHQCGTDDATEAAVASVGDDRVRYFACRDAVPMTENWELALAHARGEFVTVIGDDDGIVPGAFELADALIAAHRPRLLTWRPVTYYWPGYFNPELAGRAVYRYDIAAGNIRFSSDYALRWLYRFKWHYSDMPMIYNSFVRRDLVDSVRAQRGRYFFLNSTDVTSGVVNASHCDEFLWSNYPLSITGISRNSTGHRLVMQEDSGVKEGAMRDFMPRRVEQDWIPSVANLDFGIAAELLALREMLGLGKRLAARMEDVAEYVARQLNRYPGQIPASREALRAFCDRHGIDFDGIAERFLLDAPGTPVAAVEIETESELVMDRDLAAQGDQDIEAAARSIAERLGAPRPVSFSSVGFDPPPTAGDEAPLALTFCQTGNGVQRLGDGWNRPETFGAWACDFRASVRLPLPGHAAPGTRLRIEVAARGPISRPGDCFFYSIAIPRARVSIAGEFSALRLCGTDVLELDPQSLGDERTFELVFRCVEVVNPALRGLGDDNRPLGIGLESITVSPVAPQEAPRT